MNDPANITKDEAIIAAKTFRKEADELLQRMKAHSGSLYRSAPLYIGSDFGEILAHHSLSYRALEDCIMRQGMALKYLGTLNPYPDSKDPTNTIVNPTADGLKL